MDTIINQSSNLEVFKKTIGKIQDPVLDFLLQQNSEKDQIITRLQNNITDLEVRVCGQERYTSKDCVIMENLPLVDDKDLTLSQQVCNFLRNFLNNDTTPSNFKACHFFGPWRDLNRPPAVIIKFIYFEEKNEVYSRRSWLASVKNPKNGYSIFFKERLPPNDRDIKKYADSLGLITTTSNCQVKVYQKTEEGKFFTVNVNSTKAVDDICVRAVKRHTKKDVVENSCTTDQIHIPKDTDGEIRNLLKRLRDSPEERAGVELLTDYIQLRKKPQRDNTDDKLVGANKALFQPENSHNAEC